MAIGFLWLLGYSTSGAPELPEAFARQNAVAYNFLLNKWYFDEIYDWLIVAPVLWLGRLLWKGGDDGWLIDDLFLVRTVYPPAFLTSPATWCGCSPATCITTPSRC